MLMIRCKAHHHPTLPQKLLFFEGDHINPSPANILNVNSGQGRTAIFYIHHQQINLTNLTI